jgi:LuxR family transcriptional regulator, maltose regulon positive regulatory protein
MPQTLLKTKLYVPSARRPQVARPRLIEQLNQGASSKLTLVSASAGSGKTTLLAQWLAADETRKRSAAWLSLDDNDNREALFWSYVIAAMETVAPGVGGTAMSLLESPQAPPIEPVLTTLINDWSSLTQDIVLVLDDYHLISTREIHDSIAFLLAHLPPHIHVVIASRADPPLALARMRARGELVEVRIGELRFRPDEATAYFNDVMGLHLAERDVAAIEARTEGWIAALQLAALSMQGREDVASFIAGFAGDDRYIVDYLVEEVLERQTEQVRRFLLETSILDRLSGPLCEAVTGQAGGNAMLETLDHANLFVVPLDDRRRWYRYHHLFGDVLQARLLNDQSADVAELHRRAGKWYEQTGQVSDAIRHAFAALDFPNAANLIERVLPELRKSRQEATLIDWLGALPQEVRQVRPVLNATYAWALVATGNFEGLEDRLAEVEQSLTATHERNDQSNEIVVVDQAEYRRIPAVMALLRTAHAQAQGDVAAAMTFAHRVLDLADDNDDLLRGSAAGFLGLACWKSGDLAEGHRMYTECATHIQRAGHLADVLGCAIALADIRIAQGRLHDALRTYEQALQLATRDGEPVLRGAADMHVGIADLLRERDDLPGATRHLLRSKELGDHFGLPQNRYRWCVAMARIRQAEGDLAGALDLLQEAERLYVGDFFPNVRPVYAFKARVWIAQGNSRDALGWARERSLAADDELSYLREFEHITLARVLLASGSIEEAVVLLGRMLQAAKEGDRTGSVIEILSLQAVALQARGNTPSALVPLERALALAEPEGYVRIFVDEGPPIEVLLCKLGETSYVRRLLMSFGTAEKTPPTTLALVELLSERELEVLRLLGTDLDGPDIASELMVSLNTMRTHTKSIYAKLGVNNRRAAVRRAEELELLSPTRAH